MDKTPPVITLVGNDTAKVCQFHNYTDFGYQVHDNYDAKEYIRIELEGNFRGTDSPGLYSFRYKAIDLARNFAYSAYRYIVVISKNDSVCINQRHGDALGIFSTSEKNLFPVKLYPNPAQNEMFIQSSQFINEISIYNAAGQKIQQIDINQNINMPYRLNTKHFPAGIYIVQLKNSSAILNRKVIIKH